MTVFNCFGRCTRDGRAPLFLYLQIQQLRAGDINKRTKGEQRETERNERGTVAASWRASGTTADGWPERAFYCK